jgi:hypothetical protein
VWGLKDEEFTADFCLVSQRSLCEKDHLIFKYHFLLGADWKLCCRKLNLDRGTFFHELYRIEEKLGKTFRELQPHALFPVDEYFSSTGREAVAQSCLSFKVEAEDEEEFPRARRLLRFPVRRAA